MSHTGSRAVTSIAIQKKKRKEKKISQYSLGGRRVLHESTRKPTVWLQALEFHPFLTLFFTTTLMWDRLEFLTFTQIRFGVCFREI